MANNKVYGDGNPFIMYSDYFTIIVREWYGYFINGMETYLSFMNEARKGLDKNRDTGAESINAYLEGYEKAKKDMVYYKMRSVGMPKDPSTYIF